MSVPSLSRKTALSTNNLRYALDEISFLIIARITPRICGLIVLIFQTNLLAFTRENRVSFLMKSAAEEIRIRYLYRKIIIMGKAKVSLESARALVGPDCAFHLYGRIKRKKRKK